MRTVTGLSRGLACLALIIASTTLLSGQEKAARFPLRGCFPYGPAIRRPNVGSRRGLASPGTFSLPRAHRFPALPCKRFGLKQSFQIEFPAWMLTARFNVTARFRGGGEHGPPHDDPAPVGRPLWTRVSSRDAAHGGFGTGGREVCAEVRTIGGTARWGARAEVRRL